MTTNSVNGSNSAGGLGLNQIDSGQRQNLGQQDFLRLMVAQVQNQDPLQPQVNGEFLSQLAQFSTNDGITKMQESLQQLASSLQSNQALQASALVGRKVLVNSNTLNLGSEGDVKAAIDMAPGVSNLRAAIYTESGELIKTIPLGQPQPGFFQFSWDGTDQSNQRLTSGKYTIKVSGTYGGQEVALKTMTSANVDSVSLGQYGEDLKLNLAGVGSVFLNEVRQISV
ncbi:flagellar hook assembly protein FlgD [Legionella pneumophila]|uniref:Basal-body rod modification protein FlgD n=1 Tax=Legionella pneumophila subsp. pascullei TaxID=91890 RepID=A0AAX2IUU5_LEGPN|nr:flagellar hook assembly protein FlgD [Legionella pneumophila]AMP90073.1 flagellar biosynthesis protein FlgD [Legionella pneumophila subsp. pascullei]AMP92260.1 flagellar biosynthesis protein FlgD [Legionella pneumophila subsp. pascullei]AMP95225.1 flagellar biosynthesis protein FlgD [Legionella pneumophila subsp. pascullei]SQG90117.1 flagellar basal-body rod modification protein FlgD [Legionella pneumophila subsp. pascullei]VEH06068.1 flagellar basal-body rod modification protein FlgD [Legi